MTRARVLQLGLIILLVGGIGYESFQLAGLDPINAGIAAQLILIFIVVGWTSSYLLRVFTGKMTFSEQRKRYRKAYEEMTESTLKEKFEALSEDEKIALLEDITNEKNE